MIQTVFEDREVAWRNGIVVLKELFLAQAKYSFNFKESQIVSVEKRLEKVFPGGDVVDILGQRLWRELDFDGRLTNVDVFKSVAKLKSFLESERAQLSAYKEKIIINLEKILSKIEQLAELEGKENLEEIAKLRKMIEDGQF